MNSSAISVLAEADIQGIDAEIALRRIQSELAAPSTGARRKLEELGLGLEEIDPNLHRLVEIVRRLARARLSEEDAFEIFGRRGAPAALALVHRLDRLEELQRPRVDASG